MVTPCSHGLPQRSKCKQCRKITQDKWKKNNPEKVRLLKLASRRRRPDGYREADRRRSGVPTLNGETKTGKCPLCPFVGKLVLDHNHVTGKFRGWVCSACNRFLGFLEKRWRSG